MHVTFALKAILDMTAGRDTDVDIPIHLPGSPKGSGIVFDHVTMPGFLMAFLWALQLMSLVFLFVEPERINNGELSTTSDSGKGIGGDLEVKAYGSVALSDPEFATDQRQKKLTVWNILQEFSSATVFLFRVVFGNAAFPVRYSLIQSMHSDI